MTSKNTKLLIKDQTRTLSNYALTIGDTIITQEDSVELTINIKQNYNFSAPSKALLILKNLPKDTEKLLHVLPNQPNSKLILMNLSASLPIPVGENNLTNPLNSTKPLNSIFYAPIQSAEHTSKGTKIQCFYNNKDKAYNIKQSIPAQNSLNSLIRLAKGKITPRKIIIASNLELLLNTPIPHPIIISGNILDSLQSFGIHYYINCMGDIVVTSIGDMKAISPTIVPITIDNASFLKIMQNNVYFNRTAKGFICTMDFDPSYTMDSVITFNLTPSTWNFFQSEENTVTQDQIQDYKGMYYVHGIEHTGFLDNVNVMKKPPHSRKTILTLEKI